MASAAAYRRRKWFGVWSACLTLVLLGCSVSYGQTGVQYEVDISGVDDEELQEDLKAISKMAELQDRPPPTVSFLRRRAEDDVDRFVQLLRSRGYYGANANFEVNEKKKPVQVIFEIESGPIYTLTSVEIAFVDQENIQPAKFPSPVELGINTGVPASASTVIDYQNLILDRLKNTGHPSPVISERRVVVDHKTRNVRVAFRIEAGPAARFGQTVVKGTEEVAEEFVRSKLPWKEGERYRADLLAELQDRLVETGLFSIVRVEPAEEPGEGGLLPLTVEVRERKHRTIRLGLNYSTDEGVGGKASWEHRNFLHHGEQLKIGVEASQLALAAESSYMEPEFFRSDQSLLLSFRLAREDTDAYTSESIESALQVNRKFGRYLQAGTGLGFRLSRTDQIDDTQNFVLLSVPSYLSRDTTDNPLDPTRGGRLGVQLTPYYDLLASDLGFVKSYATYSHYVELLESPFILFAGRAAVGSIAGASRDDIPADLRFYAGGGGSIRGYPFQKVGPIEDEDPLGGKSLLELSAELRFKVTETVGFATFFDGGSAFESTYPDFNQALRWGAGAGIRYFTPIGPLRFDVAFPVNPRDDIDDPFQIYLSIGQAF